MECLRKESVLVLARNVRGGLPMGALLKELVAARRQLRVPMFQRRYCWGETQWQVRTLPLGVCPSLFQAADAA
jgi:hypothetical protein